MAIDLFRKVVDEAAPWVHDVNLHHRGESLLHPRLPELIGYAGELGIYTKLHTNATLLDEERAAAILRTPLDLISFSFDGFDAATYERRRSPAQFESTLQNILRFLRLKAEGGRRTPLTVLEVLEFPGSEGSHDSRQRHELERRFEGLPLDKLVVKQAHNWAGNIPLTGSPTDSSFVPCTFPWHGLVVMWDGKVGPCPHDFMGQIVLGDALEESLQAIFNSPAIRRLRRQHLEGGLDPSLPCVNCDSVKRKTILGIPVASLKYLSR
jgi:MoaA/NifB/PqqE/SkfB family radical SAM enzyme